MLGVEKQIFLQQMFSRDYLPLNDAISLMNKIITELNKATNDPPCDKIDSKALKGILREINSAIQPENLQLSRTTCEATGKKHLSIISIAHNDITEQQTLFTPLELAYWLPLMEEIITSDTKSMNRINCLNLVAKYQLAIKLDDAEVFLNKCVLKGYLALNNGLYFLGGRTICEFNKDLRRSYEDYVHICELCSELCCYGIPCLNCNKFMHAYCLQPALQANKECPLCNVQWGDFDFETEGNGAQSESEAEELTQIGDDHDDDSDDSDDDDGAQSESEAEELTENGDDQDDDSDDSDDDEDSDGSDDDEDSDGSDDDEESDDSDDDDEEMETESPPQRSSRNTQRKKK